MRGLWSTTPRLVLLDEPFTGLDLEASVALRATVNRLRDQGKAVVLVTHHLHEGARLADHVAVQVRGRFVYFGDDFPRDPSAFEAHYHEHVTVAS